MKLRVRLSENDEEDALEEPPEPPKLWSPEKARGAVFLGGSAVAATQILRPIPLGFLLIFGAVGALAGALLSLQEREAALVGGIPLLLVFEVFLRPSGDVPWVLATSVLAVGALLLSWGVGMFIRSAREEHGA